jgi:hypothetical protein
VTGCDFEVTPRNTVKANMFLQQSVEPTARVGSLCELGIPVRAFRRPNVIAATSGYLQEVIFSFAG